MIMIILQLIKISNQMQKVLNQQSPIIILAIVLHTQFKKQRLKILYFLIHHNYVILVKEKEGQIITQFFIQYPQQIILKFYLRKINLCYYFQLMQNIFQLAKMLSLILQIIQIYIQKQIDESVSVNLFFLFLQNQK
ncbi:unnamed protein product [Paramecium sonneborni]|uniref:Uncharacterized protein n=1 Tax=Paramecium sonneborni TaxID=65129 RepID=A0A8S1NJT7_9CILI|nr:unnamed protein product [Paramecium sonneborni]